MQRLLTTPLGWIFLLVMAWAVLGRFRRSAPAGDDDGRRRRRARVWVALWGCLFLLSSPWVADRLQVWLVEQGRRGEVRHEKEPVQAIFVFAGGLEGEGDEAPLGTESRERLHTALVIAAQQPRARLVFSGAPRRRERVGAGERMAQEAQRLGLPLERILIEPRARNTHENATYCLALAREHGWTRVGLVTSAVHAWRSRLALEKVGLVPQVMATPLPHHVKFDPLDALPEAGALVTTTSVVHELIGLAYYRCRGWI